MSKIGPHASRPRAAPRRQRFRGHVTDSEDSEESSVHTQVTTPESERGSHTLTTIVGWITMARLVFTKE